ncbi:hypothetical protein IWW38_004957, partial [Coemansia aciculifera]
MYNSFRRRYEMVEAQQFDDNSAWEERSSTARAVFTSLSLLLLAIYDKDSYIVLIDEYDVPLKEMRGKPWEDGAKPAYISFINDICKGNPRLRLGLLV